MTNAIVGIDNIRPALIRAKKIQLHTGMEGFDSPDAYGIFRHNGGKALGVTGRVYEPPDLDIFLDLILESVNRCADWLNRDKIEYSEQKDGSKVRISIPGPQLEIKSPIVGDMVGTRLDFATGFDGLTKTSLSVFSLRLVCTNGAKASRKDMDLAFKNTPGNQGKWALFCDEIVQALADTRRYNEYLNTAAQRKVTQKEINAFFKKLLGYSQEDYKELTTRKRNILDRINQATAIEMQQAGATAYALLNGVTRYTTHDLAGGLLDTLLTDNPAKLNATAHQLVGELILS